MHQSKAFNRNSIQKKPRAGESRERERAPSRCHNQIVDLWEKSATVPSSAPLPRRGEERRGRYKSLILKSTPRTVGDRHGSRAAARWSIQLNFN